MTRRKPTFIVLLVLVGACGPNVEEPATTDDAQRWAAAVCQAAVECDCGLYQQLPTDCVASASEGFTGLIDDLKYRFNRECFDGRVALLESGEDHCSMETWEGESCAVFEGVLPQGAACEPTQDVVFGLVETPCGGGRVCWKGTCVAPPGPNRERVPLGEACSIASDPCEAGGYCAPDGICKALVEEVGGACDAPLACLGSDLYCSGIDTAGDEGVCMHTALPGDACEEGAPLSCGRGPRACVDGSCVEVPPVCAFVGTFDGQYVGFDWIPAG